MKTRVAVLWVVAAALWVVVSHGQAAVKEAASEAAEGIKQDAADADSWVGWAYQKISQEVGSKADQAKGTAQDTKDRADETIKMATEKGEGEGVAGAMNKASDMASEQLGKAEEAVGGAMGKAGEAYDSAKEKMGMASDGVAHSYNDMAQHAKDNYEAAKEKASQAVGDMGAQMRDTKSEL